MSDDQGDAEFEAGPADLDAGPDRGDQGRDDGRREVSEVRRLFAGLHEDLLQIRAIASSIAERDLTDDVRAARRTVEELASRDVNAPVRDDLAGLRDMVVAIQAADPVGALGHELQPLREGLERIAAQLADDTDHRRLLDRIEGLERRLGELGAADRSEEVIGRLDTVATREQVRGLAADLRAHLADALAGLDGDVLSAEMRHVRDTVDGEAGAVGHALERVHETLLDVASGEVVGALWDEFRELRHSVEGLARVTSELDLEAPDVDALVSALREELDLEAPDVDALVSALREELDRLAGSLRPDDTAAREAAEGARTASADLRALRADLTGAVAELRSLGASVDALAASVAEPAAPVEPAGQGADHESTVALLGSLSENLASLRTELHEGLVVEPSDDLAGTLEALRVGLDGLQAGLGGLPEMHSSLDDLRRAVVAIETAGGTSDEAGAEDAGAEIREELATIRSAVESLQAQLDEGLVLAEDVELPAPSADTSGAEVADQLASLRDHLSTELDGVRAALAAEGGPGSPDGERYATVDPDTIDLLRTEIRAAGSVSEEVVDALRAELKALRRRLAVKAQERVLSDEQLRIIADVVAERLGRD